jgi:hypothetical protein
VRELLEEPKIAALGLANLRQHLLVLAAQRTCQIALPSRNEDERKKATDAFNRAIMSHARHGATFGYLASPVTGSGVAVDRTGQLALLAMREGIQDRGGFIWGVLKEDPTPATETGADPGARTHAAIHESLAGFDAKVLPILKRLRIC